MDILKFIGPIVGTFGAFLLALLAFKQRTLLDFFGRGINQTEALKRLPEQDQLDGLEIIENTLKIETIPTSGLSANQTHSIILETLQSRRKQAHTKFLVYLVFAGMGAAFAIAFLIHTFFFDTKKKIESAINEDKEKAVDILSRLDFYAKDDPVLVARLAAETSFDTKGEDAHLALMDKICQNPKSKSCNRVVRDLRNKAKKGLPPFNDVGVRVRFGIVDGQSEPKRFTVHVSPSFEYANRVVKLSYRGRQLRLFAEPKMGAVDDVNFLHINTAQANSLRAPKGNAEASGRNINEPYKDSAFVEDVSRKPNPQLFDPTCPNYWNQNRNPSLCQIEGKFYLNQYRRIADDLS